jgi:regulator of replication initiation timing
MGRITIAMKVGFIWAIISFLIGCAQFQEMVNPQAASQNQKIEQLTTEIQNSLLKNHTLKQENKKLRADNFGLVKANAKLKTANRQLMSTNSRLKTDNRQLMDTNDRLKTDNQDLAMKIDILKILDHRVEEKRKSFTSD